MDETLKPCKFCGNPSDFTYTRDKIIIPEAAKVRLGIPTGNDVLHRHIVCMGCGAQIPSIIWNMEPDVTDWNMAPDVTD